MQDNHVSSYVRTIVTTTTGLNDSFNSSVSVADLLKQVSVAEEPGLLSQLCGDGASKLANYVLPVLVDRLQSGKDVSSFAFLLAAYGHYLQHGTDDTGEPYTIDEPQLNEEDWLTVQDGDSVSCLTLSPFAGAHLLSFPTFVAQYKAYRNQIACYGLAFSLKQTLCAFWEDLADISEPVLA